MKSYRPLWPETTIFVGAGATASLGMPMTAAQGKCIDELAHTEELDGLEELLEKNEWFSPYNSDVYDLLVLLGHRLKSRITDILPEEQLALDRQFPMLGSEDRTDRLVGLRRHYDWDALRRVVLACPNVKDKGNLLRDVFNILDMHIQSGSGFEVSPNGFRDHGDGPMFLHQQRLIGARNALVMLINLMFACGYQRLLKRPDDALSKYCSMAHELGKLMQEEGLRLHAAGIPMDDRRFFLMSYAIVSLNFDPLFLWFLMNANGELNKNHAPYVSAPGTAAAPLRMFSGLGHPWAVRRIVNPAKADGSGQIWHPFNEASLQRVNDPEHSTGRRARISKFFFPHGSCCWRQCPNCGKLTVHLGEEWSVRSPTLFPPSLLKSFLWGSSPRSREEEQKREGGHYDAVQCLYCGSQTAAQHVPMIMQTSFKGDYPPCIEETQREVRACLQGTRHIVFLGYSLPPDDTVWRAFLAARKSREEKVYCSVVSGQHGPDRWLMGEELADFVEKNRGDTDLSIQTIESAFEIFDKDRVRAYTGGIPQVFGEGTDVRVRLKEMLYPESWGPDCFKDPLLGRLRDEDTARSGG